MKVADKQKINVFVLGTEYHFLMAMCIIEEHFRGEEYLNRLVFLGRRLSDINKNQLPENFQTIDLFFEKEKNIKHKVKHQIFSGNIINLFMVNVYRNADTYIVSSAPKSTKRHLIQDGALFYNRIEKSILGHRIKETFRIYTGLWKKGVLFTDLLLYTRFMENSNYVDEIWLTNPDIYIGPDNGKKRNIIHFFKESDAWHRVSACFNQESNGLSNLSDCLIYLSPIMRNLDKVPDEIIQIRELLKKWRKKNVFIKLHPAASTFQFEKLKKAFGVNVIKNYIPAELYISNARNSVVVGCASTTLLYHNPNCEYFALKKHFQKLGIYDSWKNIQLPHHVKVVDDLSDINYQD